MLSPQFSLDTRIVASAKQVSSLIDDETVILSLTNGFYYGLDAVGSRIWNLIQVPIAVRCIHTTLLGEYEVNSQQCEHDILLLIEALSQAELIEVVDEKDN